MQDKLKPVITAYYDPVRKDWNEAIEAELEKRGLTTGDLNRFCIFAFPKTKQPTDCEK